MAGRVSRLVGVWCVLSKKRGIAYNEVELRSQMSHVEGGCAEVSCPKVQMLNADAVGPRTCRHILTGLLHCLAVDVDSKHMQLRSPLSKHQGNEASARTDVKSHVVSLHLGPGSEQHSVGADFHGTAIVTDAELPEIENIFTSHAAKK
jgi:hypothetical protein